ncbi:hypothetical protein CKO31_21735 [Thiohalocapsa halophila]|uniref:Helix-hairpin-helix domain-containing protein n=1 Tax=Thiohalocapsa halophila TaxID=69359 RepID=A0ABS1CN53_9GAMM|nr:hypothetical protein [Thiohalocapsa halophila]
MVERGLARVFGVYRTSPDGLSRDDYRDHLKDAELCAAAERVGARAYTDRSAIRSQRAEGRQEQAELDLAAGRAPPTEMLDINTVARDELMRIPGIGDHFANLIIEHRPYEG